MRTLYAALFAILAVLIVVPTWSGEKRLDLLGGRPQMTVTRVALDPANPKRRRVGDLTFIGGVELASRDPAFGGYSSLAVSANRFTLLSDGGNIVWFTMGDDWKPRGIAFANLPDGPGIGWEKRDRDSESMTVDPKTGRIWVGFENSNAIWRYSANFVRAQAQAAPTTMSRWPDNGGPESMVRLADGRFVVLSEQAHIRARYWRGSDASRLRTREGLIFRGDPTTDPRPPQRFAYVPRGKSDPSDIAALPDGDLLVLDRSFRLPFRFSATVSRIAARDVARGRIAFGRLVARLDEPLIHDNYEGIAVTQQTGPDGKPETIVWIVSDNNQTVLQRTLLLKFRLNDPRR